MAPVVAPLRLLSDCELGDHCAVGLEVAADLSEAESSVAQAQRRCLARLVAEVLAPLEQRLHSHEQLREALRLRQRLSKFSEAAQNVATLRRGEAGEGPPGRGHRQPPPGLQAMELSLTPRMATRLLEELLPRMRGTWEPPEPWTAQELQRCLRRAADEAQDQWLGEETTPKR